MSAHVGYSVGHFGLQGDLEALSRKITSLVEMGSSICELNASNLDVVAACRLMPERLNLLKSVLARHKTGFSLHAPIAINLMDELHIDLQLKAALVSLELASEIEANTVVFHPGRVHPGVWVDNSKALLHREVEHLTSLAARAHELGVQIAYENLNPNRHNVAGTETSYALDLSALATQIERVNHPALGVCFDVSHAMQGATLQNYSLLEQLPKIAPHIRHIHYSDATGVPATIKWNNDGERLFFGVGDMHAAPGFGTIDFDAIAAVLSVPTDTNIVIELKENHFAHSGPQTLRAAKEFARKLGLNTELA